MIKISEPQLGLEEAIAVDNVLGAGRLAQGPQVAAFEEGFAEYVGAQYGVAVGNGTQALHLALLAHDVGPGDEVITTPFSFIATASAIMMCGAKPVFVDVEEDTGNINIDLIADQMTENKPDPIGVRTGFRTGAILPVHVYGYPAKTSIPDEVVTTLAPMYGNRTPIVWDACQAHGALLDDHGVGALGLSCWSFYATKNMTTGEGGMITTNDYATYQHLLLLRSHGQAARYIHTILGYNYRMTEMQAAIGRVQLRKLPEMQLKRHANAAYLTEYLRNIDGISTPTVRPGVTHAWHQYTIRVLAGREARDKLHADLLERGIQTGIYYPTPLHLQPMFAHLGHERGDFPVAEMLSDQVLSLPVHPGLSERDLAKIVWEVEKCVG